jgi:hypothetical protein
MHIDFIYFMCLTLCFVCVATHLMDFTSVNWYFLQGLIFYCISMFKCWNNFEVIYISSWGKTCKHGRKILDVRVLRMECPCTCVAGVFWGIHVKNNNFGKTTLIFLNNKDFGKMNIQSYIFLALPSCHGNRSLGQIWKLAMKVTGRKDNSTN